MSLEETYQVERIKWDTLAEQNLGSLRILRPEESFYSYLQRNHGGYGGFPRRYLR